MLAKIYLDNNKNALNKLPKAYLNKILNDHNNK
jgi:hypothetical protein